MKPEEQHIEIATSCGWKVEPSGHKRHPYVLCKYGKEIEWSDRFDKIWDAIPDYLNDLNAMHEAEKTLDDKQRLLYLRHLTQLPNYGRCATAAQRAEAYLRTTGKWKEEE